MANIFEPERSIERLAWSKSGMLVEVIRSFFDKDQSSAEHRKVFITDFKAMCRGLAQKDR